MHKGLKPELEKIVTNLHIGDGIIIKHQEYCPYDKSIGYVQKINSSNLILNRTRESRFFLGRLFQSFFGTQRQLYCFFEDIKIVDPAKIE